MANSRVIDRVGQVLGGRYRLIASIGTGASASVFLADDVVLRRRVAVKVLHAALADDEAFLRRFRAEAQAAAALNHPNVMSVHDWGDDEDVPYLVTEFLGGGSLRSMLDVHGKLSLSQALVVGLETARGLDYASRQGFVHRDIKPANLLFDDEARLRIADFGLARALAEAAWTEPMGAVLGTAKYASPEQARGEPLDGRSDVYSLALVVIEAATGTVPFAGDTTLGTLMARVDKPLELPAALGPLRPALAAAGSPDPAERCDAAGFAAALLDAANHLERPAALPLAGVRSLEAAGIAPADPTVVVGAAGQEATGRWQRAAGGAAAGTAGAAAGTALVGHTGVDPDPSDGLDVPAWVRAGGPEAGTTVLPIDEGVAAADPAVGHGGDPGDQRPSRAERKAAKRAEQAAAAGPPVDAPPRRTGRRVLITAAVLAVLSLLAAGGVYAYQEANRTPTFEVPSLVGARADAVDELVARTSWTVDRQGRFDDTAPVGEIIEQDPPPGTVLEEGVESRLTVVVSQGPAPVPVPTDLVGLTVAEAEARLVEADLVLGEVEEAHHEEAADGTVLAVLGDLEPEVLPGTAVPLQVSSGPAPREIPAGLAGIAGDDAAAQLEALGLVVDRQEAFSDDVPEGQSMGTDPQPGTMVPRGSTVVVTVSKGPELLPVPDVRGMSVADAAAELERQGFEVDSIEGSPRRNVRKMDPKQFTMVAPGTSIQLSTR